MRADMPEMSQSHTPWSSRHGSESPSVEVAVDVRRYAILELHAKNDDDLRAECLETGIPDPMLV